jgi:glycosyltransferase involved in cell wall biosynthesis
MRNMPDPAAPLPMVSVIVPCRDEATYIGACLDSIAASDYPKDRLEVLVVDGSSTDGTRDIIADRADRHPFIRRIHNQQRTTPVALNLGIKEARGSYIAWMSAHNSYPPNYLSESVRWAERSGADNVGGVIVTRSRTVGLWADAVRTALTHRFGVGSSHFRVHPTEPTWVDTVFGGCYRRDVFDRIGLFNESLTRGQDMEFNLRLRRAGGKTLLIPTIRSEYNARSSPVEFARHTWVNGEWAILPFMYSDGPPVGARHLVPLAFALCILAGIVVVLSGGGWWLVAVVTVPYALASLGTSFVVALKERRPALLVVLPAAFAVLHLGYGFGSVSGTFKVIWRRLTGAGAR